MSLNTKRLFFVIINCFISAFLGAQTLYWVGGSGNFNDPQHWSSTSGGPTSNLIPNLNTDVVFDDNSSKGYFIVNIAGINKLKNLRIEFNTKGVKFTGTNTSSLVLSGTMNLSRRVKFEANSQILFESTSLLPLTINFQNLVLKNDVSFGNGNYIIENLQLSDNNTMKFGGGKYTFNAVSVSAGNIINDNNNAQFEFYNSYLVSQGKFKIAPQANIKSEGLQVMADLNSSENYFIPSSLSSSKGYTSVNTVNVVCPVTITWAPACSGPCTGILTVSLSGSCTNPPYSVQAINPSCSSSLAVFNNTNIPSVFTVTNACYCSASNYIIQVRDGSNTVQTTTNGINFTPNPAFIVNSDSPPSCSYLCDGVLMGSIFGSPPFSVTVASSSTTSIAPFTTASGDYTITGVCPGTYTFNVIDAGGCLSSVPITLNNATALLPNAVTTSITCNGLTNGAFAISPSGGSANYTVNFSTPSTFTTNGSAVAATNLGVGVISATVTDANSCTVTASSIINQPAQALSVGITATNPLCFGACTGSVTSNVSGGTAPYTYSWSVNTSTNSSLTALCASAPAVHTLTVKDFNNCSNSTQTFVITEPPAISVPFTQTNVVCSGSCTGVASFTPTGGTGAITFTWVAPGSTTLSGNGPTQSNLCSFPTAYTVNVKDANQCTLAPIPITITQPTPIALSIVTKSVDCFGAITGGATVTATGGNSGSYSYSWTPPGGLTTSVITVGAGTYSLVVFDASLCATSQSIVTIIQPAAVLSAAATRTDLTCNSSNAPCNGIINVVPSGGTPAYSYTLSGPGTTITTAPPYNGLCAGIYTVFVKDGSGCTIAPPVTTTLSQPPVLTPTVTITTPISCAGTSVGVITGTASGGTSPYTYTWTTPSAGSVNSATLSGIPSNPSPYTLTVADSRGCTNFTSVTLGQPPAITITVANSTISCFSACNGSFSASVSGGLAPYNYAWTNSLSAIVGTNSTINSLCPGQYTLTVTDAALCTRTTVATVISPPPLVLTATSTPVNCFGDFNGSATVTASGGTTPYAPNYTLASATSTNLNAVGIFGGLAAVAYTAFVKDNNSCVQTTSFVVGTPNALTAVISGTNSCSVCNGLAAVTPTFGTAPYTYTWSSSTNPNFANTSTVGGLCVGNYTATVVDSKGCSITRTVAITQVVNISIIASPPTIVCNSATTGVVQATVTSGVGPFSYTWTPSGQNTPTLSNVGAGTYTLFVKDSSTPLNCSHSITVALVQPPAITVTATQTNVTCFSYSNGVISATATGGTGAMTYTWLPGGANTQSISNLVAGVYTLTVRDANLCTNIQTYSVSQSPSITITHTAVNPSGCASPNGNICLSPTGGSGAGYTYSWSPVVSTSSCISGLNGGTYQCTVTDGAGCFNTKAITLFNATGPTLTAVSNSITCFGASTGAATVTAAGAGGFTFAISPSTATSSIASGVILTGLTSGSYVVNCTDLNGCVTNTQITMVQSPSVTINSAFANAKCFGTCNGSITVAPTQGTVSAPSFTYNWLPVSPTITGQGTGTVTNLCANPYTLNLTTAPNCLTQYTFSITQPPAFTVTAVTSSLLCNSICNGSIVANASGGTGVLNYSWTPVGGNTQTVTNLCATGGTNVSSYTLTITDVQSCTATATYTIAQPPPLTSTVSFVNATCSNSCNAVASVTASGGVPGYNYSWSTGTLTSTSIGSLCPATSYSSTVTDNNGCIFTNSFNTPSVAPLSLTLTPSNPLCNGASNGSIATTVSGAQGAMNYTWSPSGTGQNPTGLSAVPNPIYTVVARDQNSCQVVATTTLVNPPALTASVNVTNPLCNQGSNGSATVVTTNAVGATTYTWVQTSGTLAQTTQTVNGLAAGSYTVRVKDNNQCQTSQTFSVTDPSSITVNTSSVSPSCNLANGSITLTPTGGTPGSPVAYTFSWTTLASTSSVVATLTAGAYPVVVTDGVGCTNTVSVLLNNSNGPTTIPVVSSSIVCNAQCTGAASVDISGIIGGTPSYTATWISPSSSVNAISGLCAGTYTAQILDFAGCISFTDVTIAEPPPIVINPIVGLPICPGICNGTIDINASGGNAPYTYTWAPVSSNSPTLSGLCAGDYTVVIGYNSGCTDTSFINIPDMSSITIVPTVTNNICFGTCSAVATVSVSGGTSPYNVSWSNSQTGLTINNLCNGDYTVSVTDNNGCNNTATTSVSSGPQMTSSTSVVSPSCGACNGTASVTVSGGTSPLSYNWSNSATTPSLANMCAGLYQVVVTDALSCSQTHTVIINNSNGITGETINTQQIPCSGSCVGAATVAAIGGNVPISYNWISPASSSSVITNLCPGTYFVQMSDAQNCVRIASVTINPLVSLTVSPFVQLPACNSSDGSINLVISGGTPSYSITWNPPAGNTTSITGINSGVYSFTVTESGTNSCSVSQVINMSNSTGPVLTVEQHNVNCFDACTGSITVVASSTNGPLSYQWSNGANTPTVVNVCPGIITVTVTDQGGCKTIRSFTITDNPRLRLVGTTIENPSCAGDCDGVITLNPSGGVFPYTFTWTPVASTANPLTALCDGVYSAQVVDSKGCFVNSPTYTIVSSSFLVLSSSTFSSSCSSVADGTINVVPSGGVSEYLFSWQGPAGYTATTQNLTNIFSGNYTVTVTDNVGCQKDSVLSVVPSITIVARAGDNAVICQETGSVVIDGNASSGSFSYKWYKLSDNVNSIASTPSYTVRNLFNPETYVLVATSSVAACFDRDTVDVNLYPVPFVDAGRDYTVPIYTSVQIGGNPTSPSAVSLTWAPAAYLSDPNSSNPIASSTLVTTYTVTMTDVNGCTVSDSITVDLYPELKISSGFSPNNDGKNDLWLIDYIDQFPNTSVEIFNRWGDRVFEAPKGYDTPFDGKYKGTDLPVGTYYYIININHPGYPKPITGPLTIFR